MITPALFCKVCGLRLHGRKDKKYCNLNCKNTYHFLMRQAHYNEVAFEINFLLRNRTILKEILDQEGQKKAIIPKPLLQSQGFHFGNFTGAHTDKYQNTHYYLFDYIWTILPNKQVLLQKRRNPIERSQTYVPLENSPA